MGTLFRRELRLLITTFPSRSPMYTIKECQLEAARNRWAAHLPAHSLSFCASDAADFTEQVASADAMLGYMFPTTRIPQAGSLRLIQLMGAGFNHLLPLDWLPKKVALANASGVHADKLREWAMMVFLMLHTNMPHFVTAQREHVWSKAYSSLVGGRTAVIFGVGGIGSAIASAARALGIRTIGVRRSMKPARGFDAVVGSDDAERALETADFVILATPLTEQTRHMMNPKLFGKMRAGAGFANFGRGGLVDHDALLEALRSGRLSGAIIDVTEPEPPPPESALWDAPRLIITPHLSCDDPESYIPRTLDLFFDNVRRLHAGRPIRNRVLRSRSY